MTGSRGPVPKRETQRRRRNKDEMTTKSPVVLAGVPVPPGDQRWHPLALSWYESLTASGQARFYEPSDWATAALVAESISRELKPQPVIDAKGKVHRISRPVTGAALAAWLKAMTSLMVTEGDRRRLRMELQRLPEGEEAENVSELDQYRDRIPTGDAGSPG